MLCQTQSLLLQQYSQRPLRRKHSYKKAGMAQYLQTPGSWMLSIAQLW
jgi:hypothetical protein